MIYSQILVSSILIICGFLVKKNPNLIAGYNTLSKTKKDKININTLSTFLKQLLIGLGIFTILNYFIFKLIIIEESKILYINSAILIIGLLIGLIYANTHKKFKN